MVETSVVIPSYNRDQVIRRAIQSVRNQEYEDFELIVVDDCSEDGTVAVVEGFDDPRITLKRHTTNQGANAARNTGISEASGDFISFLDSDDEFHPDHLETVISHLSRAPEDIGGVSTGYQKSMAGEIVTQWRPPTGRISLDDALGKQDRFRSRKNILGGFSCMTFRATVFDEIGLLDEELASLQDLDFYLRCLQEYDIIGIPDHLVTYYRDGDQISSNLNAKQQGIEQFIKKHRSILDDKMMANFHYTLGFVYAEHADMPQASREFRNAISRYPLQPLYYYHYLTAKLGKSVFDKGMGLKRRIAKLV